ncbi:MAG TPA: crotonase/enoyl-CoA hydratase family protein [Rhodobiaceae bacterium]|nr:crotonase/enoyl-CoA hydratase family protein [Rhodobiaceae bacterium]
MTNPVTYTLEDGVAHIAMDDGKVNAMSPTLLQAIHDAFDQAEKDKAVVLLSGNDRIFSAGFDMGVFATGTADDIHRMMTLGADLTVKLLSFPFPFPVVAACTGSAYPMGAFLLLSSDLRIGANNGIQIGLNEVRINMTLPYFATELARYRLAPAYFNRTATTGELYDAEDAQRAGFLDKIVAPDVLMQTAKEAAAELRATIGMGHHAATKMRVRAPVIEAVKAAAAKELSLESAQRSVDAR